ncbi:S8 family serine peptidase [Amycolatopsis sp. QT-25]|uniref:S8 family peptidase n=1 Tax=Amycolatopsis sp. QT-25 TaxID=3034022 RepID=UPI0023ED3125|nr:S8 family peptidase [Amycolatopsis sp. QT-25]WET76949.1 S8 family serine peptidase [Amycolatopsis sp. QT-25]
MRKLLLTLGALTPLLALGIGNAVAAEAEGVVVQAKQHYGEQYIVVLKNGVATAQASASSLTGRFGGEVRSTWSAALNGFSVKKMTEKQARRLAADPSVKTVYQDGTARGADTQTNPTWGLDRVDQKTLPLDKKYTYNNSGAGVTAYDLDSGINPDNPEYEGRASLGKDFMGGDGKDCNGHGSHTAGTIASKTYGVAKKVKIVGLKVLGCDNSGPDSGIIDAVDWVTANAKKPAVANMSLTMDAPGVGDDALKKSIASGVVYGVASGNASTDACNTSPARVPEAITVNATDSSDNRSSFSNYGSCTDIFAPGSDITSLSPSNGGSAVMNGTSMATPHVVGAAALYLAANPSATPKQVRDALVGNASDAVVKNPGNGSPNKLLNVSFIGGGGPEPTCGPKSNTAPVAIPDAGAAVTSSITQEGCDGKASSTLPVKVDISHTYSADLAVSLIGPSGTTYRLKKAGGTGSWAGVHETYTVDASGENANGAWKLSVQDVYQFDTGSIDGFAITF